MHGHRERLSASHPTDARCEESIGRFRVWFVFGIELRRFGIIEKYGVIGVPR